MSLGSDVNIKQEAITLADKVGTYTIIPDDTSGFLEICPPLILSEINDSLELGITCKGFTRNQAERLSAKLMEELAKLGDPDWDDIAKKLGMDPLMVLKFKDLGLILNISVNIDKATTIYLGLTTITCQHQGGIFADAAEVVQKVLINFAREENITGSNSELPVFTEIIPRQNVRDIKTGEVRENVMVAKSQYDLVEAIKGAYSDHREKSGVPIPRFFPGLSSMSTQLLPFDKEVFDYFPAWLTREGYEKYRVIRKQLTDPSTKEKYLGENEETLKVQTAARTLEIAEFNIAGYETFQNLLATNSPSAEEVVAGRAAKLAKLEQQLAAAKLDIKRNAERDTQAVHSKDEKGTKVYCRRLQTRDDLVAKIREIAALNGSPPDPMEIFVERRRISFEAAMAAEQRSREGHKAYYDRKNSVEGDGSASSENEALKRK